MGRTGDAQSRRRGDADSPGFGRLLSVELAAEYLDISAWLLRQYIQAGELPVTRLPRPATASAPRGRRLNGEPLRLILIDRLALDEWVDPRCTRERLNGGVFGAPHGDGR